MRRLIALTIFFTGLYINPNFAAKAPRQEISISLALQFLLKDAFSDNISIAQQKKLFRLAKQKLKKPGDSINSGPVTINFIEKRAQYIVFKLQNETIPPAWMADTEPHYEIVFTPKSGNMINVGSNKNKLFEEGGFSIDHFDFVRIGNDSVEDVIMYWQSKASPMKVVIFTSGTGLAGRHEFYGQHISAPKPLAGACNPKEEYFSNRQIKSVVPGQCSKFRLIIAYLYWTCSSEIVKTENFIFNCNTNKFEKSP